MTFKMRSVVAVVVRFLGRKSTPIPKFMNLSNTPQVAKKLFDPGESESAQTNPWQPYQTPLLRELPCHLFATLIRHDLLQRRRLFLRSIRIRKPTASNHFFVQHDDQRICAVQSALTNDIMLQGYDERWPHKK